MRDLFAGLDDEAEELAERLEFGDDESVWAWVRHHYPKALAVVTHKSDQLELVAVVRELYEGDGAD